jgi:histidinol-phosphate aminotransferase
VTAIPAARTEILSLRSYKAGDQVPDTVRLNANEAPVSADTPALNRYPDVHPVRLRERLATLLEVPSRNLLVTRGSSEAIDVLIRAWCRAYTNTILTTPPTFDMYRVYAEIQGVEITPVPLDDCRDYALDKDALLARCDATTSIVFICSPNNPTGSLVPRDDILDIVESLSGRTLVVVDEAYVEFSSADSLAAVVNEHNNLVVLRTLSKAHALAGARCGAAIACEDIIDVMSKVLPPYSFPSPVIESVMAALTDERVARASQAVAAIVAERGRLYERLQRQAAIEQVWPSEANFLFAKFRNLTALQQYLLKRRILIRDFSSQPGLDNCARITVGTPEENDALLDALEEYGETD